MLGQRLLVKDLGTYLCSLVGRGLARGGGGGFWSANVLGVPRVVGCSMTLHVPGRGVHVEGRAEKAVAPLS